MSAIQRERLDAQLRGAGVGSEQSVAETRENFAKLMSAMPVPDGIRVHDTSLAGRPALRVVPDAEAGPATLLYLHGGSHVVGSPRTALGLTAGLVTRTGIPGISLDYRLAPEHPFPADVEDVVAAYQELLEQGHAPESIAFAGDSAGGGLTITGARPGRALPAPARPRLRRGAPINWRGQAPAAPARLIAPGGNRLAWPQSGADDRWPGDECDTVPERMSRM